MKPTIEYLRSHFDYDPCSGDFIRKSDGFIYKNPDPSHGYIRVRVEGVLYYAHRLIWAYVYGEHPKGEIDHKNRVRWDNRISNLQDVSKKTNARNKNMLSNNTSGVTGVYLDKKSGKWCAEVMKNRKKYYVGRFVNIEAAKQARYEKMIELGFAESHGETTE